LKMKANRLSEKLATDGCVTGSYKGRDVKIHEVIDMPVDSMLKNHGPGCLAAKAPVFLIKTLGDH